MSDTNTAPSSMEAEYNNRARVPDHQDIIDSWQKQSSDWRAASASAELDIPYGTSARQQVDIFHPVNNKAGPIVMFIHGGYWQALGRESFSHMARGANLNGLTVAVPSYDLCPTVSVSDIIRQMQECCLFLWQRYRRRIVVCGHSAGGHLAACMMATDWRSIDPNTPPLLAAGALPISGLFELEPLVSTSINDGLNLTVDTARAASPALWAPPSGLKMVVAVGGDESSEYLRQANQFAHSWHKQGVAALARILKGENHFTVISSLAEENGVLTKTLTGLASTAT
ncbi:MAG: alpha/beta hydrolase [Hyphomicrobiales bacterium]